MTRRRVAPFVLALVVALGLMPISPASAAKNRPPRIKRAVMKDVNGNGLANKVILTYTERINHRVDRDGRYPFRIQGYKIRRVNKARRALRLVILVKPLAKAKARPDFIRYTRTRRQPVKDLKKLQAAKQLLTKNIVGVPLPTIPQHRLTVRPNGPGSVTSNPAGIDCGSDCQHDYDENTAVTLTAVPDEGASPDVSWTGDCASATNTCTVTMDAAKTVDATFTAAGSRSLSVSKEGNGTVTSSSVPTQETQINCGATCASTTASYPDGTIVTLTATPGQEGMLITWGGHCSGTGETCTLTMDAAKSVSVKFELPMMTVVLAGTGSGRVTSNPAGIDCGSDCTHEFAKDEDVTLTAAPVEGSQFAGWSGGATCGANLSCVVPMNETKEVTATFNLAAAGPVMRALTLEVDGGTVQCSADGGVLTTCDASYEDGTELTIVGTPTGLDLVPVWGGDCAGTTGLTCNLNMTQDRSVTLTFDSGGLL